MEVLFMLALALGFMLLLRSTQRHAQKKEWNNGACFCGAGFMKSFGMDSGGATGYSCTECNRTIWLDWYRPR
jgi:hypothetical protein